MGVALFSWLEGTGGEVAVGKVEDRFPTKALEVKDSPRDKEVSGPIG